MCHMLICLYTICSFLCWILYFILVVSRVCIFACLSKLLRNGKECKVQFGMVHSEMCSSHTEDGPKNVFKNLNNKNIGFNFSSVKRFSMTFVKSKRKWVCKKMSRTDAAWQGWGQTWVEHLGFLDWIIVRPQKIEAVFEKKKKRTKFFPFLRTVHIFLMFQWKSVWYTLKTIQFLYNWPRARKQQPAILVMVQATGRAEKWLPSLVGISVAATRTTPSLTSRKPWTWCCLEFESRGLLKLLGCHTPHFLTECTDWEGKDMKSVPNRKKWCDKFHPERMRVMVVEVASSFGAEGVFYEFPAPNSLTDTLTWKTGGEDFWQHVNLHPKHFETEGCTASVSRL